MSRALRVAALAVLLGGCAIPQWVPWIGKPAKREAMAPPPAPADETLPEPPSAARATTAEKAQPIDEHVADRIIAVVNNDAITLGEVLESIAVFRYENRDQRVTETDDELMHRFLARLIDSRLQLQEAEREKIVVEDAEVEEEIADRMKRFNTPTREDFEALLKREGISMEIFRKKLRDAIRVAKVIRRKVTFRISVTNQEIDQYLEANRQKLETGLAYHARHLLISPTGPSDAAWQEARVAADRLHAELLGGADFAELARKNSRDASAKDGGDLGTLHRGELAQDIETQILQLRPGEISAPYRSELGYHIFRLESKESLEGEGATRAREQIRGILFREKYEARLEAWLKEIKRRAVIEVRL